MARRPIQTDDDALVKPASVERGDEVRVNGPTLSEGFERIQTRVFDLPDPDSEYRSLEKALMLGTQQFDSITAALDQAEDNARRAHRLYVNARVDAERFGIEADVVEGGLWSLASAELQREKDSGARTKQITDGDVKSRVSTMFPDQWRELQEKRIKTRKMMEHLERIADLWKTRCYSLAAMLASKR